MPTWNVEKTDSKIAWKSGETAVVRSAAGHYASASSGIARELAV